MISHSFEGAVFDVDGTILDSMEVWGKATNRFYNEHNLILSDDEASLFQSMTLEESIPYIIKTHNLNMTSGEVEKILKSFIVHSYKYEIPAKPYVIEYIKKIHKDGIKIAIATSGYPEFCKSAFERLGISDCISAYALSSEVGVNKSNPDVYLLAASRINKSPEKCIVFEDIAAGIRGAKKGGFTTCAVADKSNISETDILKIEADIYISSWKELL